MDYLDVHLSHVAQMVWEGFFGTLDIAIIEVSGITADGELIPSSSVGNNKTWIDQAGQVILEVNAWQPADLEGMHDIYYGTALPPQPQAAADPAPARPHRCAVPASARRRRSSRSSRPSCPTAPRPFQPLDDNVTSSSLRTCSTSCSTRSRVAACPRTCCRVQSGRRQHRQRRARRPRQRPVPAADRLHRGHPGRHAGAAALGHADVRRRPPPSRSATPAIADLRDNLELLPRPDHPSSRRRSATIPRWCAGSAAWP